MTFQHCCSSLIFTKLTMKLASSPLTTFIKLITVKFGIIASKKLIMPDEQNSAYYKETRQVHKVEISCIA